MHGDDDDMKMLWTRIELKSFVPLVAAYTFDFVKSGSSNLIVCAYFGMANMHSVVIEVSTPLWMTWKIKHQTVATQYARKNEKKC